MPSNKPQSHVAQSVPASAAREQQQQQTQRFIQLPEAAIPRVALATAVLICLVALAGFALKAVGLQAWRDSRARGHYASLEDGDLHKVVVDGRVRGWLYFHGADLHGTKKDKNNWDTLYWLALALGLLTGLSMVWGVLRRSGREEMGVKLRMEAPGREEAVFIFLSVIHAKSARFDPTFEASRPYQGSITDVLPSKGGCCADGGGCWGNYDGGVFDLETWACDLQRWRAVVDDPHNYMGRVCAGEAGSRWLILVVVVLSVSTVAMNDLERRRVLRDMQARRERVEI